MPRKLADSIACVMHIHISPPVRPSPAPFVQSAWSNSHAKIDSRKVFYRSNRNAKDIRSMTFAADLPLWPGSNMVTVIARSNAEVKSVKQMFVYRDPPRTAQKSP